MDNIEDRDIWKAYSVPEMNIQTANYFVSLGSGQFLLAGGKANTEELFSILDFTDEELRSPVDFWPDDDTPGPLYAKQNVYMLCHLNSQRNRILYANTGGRYMFIASLQNRKLKEEVVIYSSLPKYEIGQDGNFHYTREGEHGIYSYTTHDRIYAQVGRTREEVRRKETYKNYPRTYFDELEVYDWDGNFIDNYQTDKPFFTFAISPDNKYLYTLSLDLETNLDVVMRYEL